MIMSYNLPEWHLVHLLFLIYDIEHFTALLFLVNDIKGRAQLRNECQILDHSILLSN